MCNDGQQEGERFSKRGNLMESKRKRARNGNKIRAGIKGVRAGLALFQELLNQGVLMEKLEARHLGKS